MGGNSIGAAWARHAMCESAFKVTVRLHGGWGGLKRPPTTFLLSAGSTNFIVNVITLYLVFIYVYTHF